MEKTSHGTLTYTATYNKKTISKITEYVVFMYHYITLTLQGCTLNI